MDTSGNPPASKVYRAARIVLAAGPVDGYFGSGSGVASQEQFHSARGFVKAFLEEQIDVPVVIRLGGNSEDKAVEILEWLNGWVPAPVEGYKKDDPPDHCASRLHALIGEGARLEPKPRPEPARVGEPRLYQFKTVTGGTITYDHSVCAACESQICVTETPLRCQFLLLPYLHAGLGDHFLQVVGPPRQMPHVEPDRRSGSIRSPHRLLVVEAINNLEYELMCRSVVPSDVVHDAIVHCSSPVVGTSCGLPDPSCESRLRGSLLWAA